MEPKVMDEPTELTRDEILAQKVIIGMDHIERFVNNLTLDESKTASLVGNYFNSMHRTLQQSLIRILVYAINYIARWHEEHPSRTDLRNEGAIQWVKEVSKIQIPMPFV